jgi:hypothetical protein
MHSYELVTMLNRQDTVPKLSNYIHPGLLLQSTNALFHYSVDLN